MNVNEINSCLQLKERVSFRCRTGVRVSLYVLLPGETQLGRIRLPQSKLFLFCCRTNSFDRSRRDFDSRSQSKLYLCSLSHKGSSGWVNGTSTEDHRWSCFVLPHTRRLQPNSTTNTTNSTDFESRSNSLGPLGPQVTRKEAPNKLYSICTQDCSYS